MKRWKKFCVTGFILYYFIGLKQNVFVDGMPYIRRKRRQNIRMQKLVITYRQENVENVGNVGNAEILNYISRPI